MTAAIAERNAGGSTTEIIAAALNAWPGMHPPTLDNGECIVLPLTAQENGNGK